jgi:hypothetical protein
LMMTGLYKIRRPLTQIYLTIAASGVQTDKQETIADRHLFMTDHE